MGNNYLKALFAVHGIRVMNGEKGIFAAMPSVKDSKGEYRDVCFFSTQYSHDRDCYA